MKEENVMECEWVTGRYSGEQARKVKSHADIGIGYFIREESGKGTNYGVIAAIRRPMDGPRPDHLLPVSEETARKLDELYQQRHGLIERRGSGFTAAPKTILKDSQLAQKTLVTSA